MGITGQHRDSAVMLPPDTVMKYDDNRQKLQKKMTDILADLV